MFRSAIATSGAEVSYHSTIGKTALAFNNTIKLGRYLGCTQAVAAHVWDCINTRSTNDIIRATTTIPIELVSYQSKEKMSPFQVQPISVPAYRRREIRAGQPVVDIEQRSDGDSLRYEPGADVDRAECPGWERGESTGRGGDEPFPMRVVCPKSYSFPRGPNRNNHTSPVSSP